MTPQAIGTESNGILLILEVVGTRFASAVIRKGHGFFYDIGNGWEQHEVIPPSDAKRIRVCDEERTFDLVICPNLVEGQSEALRRVRAIA